MIKKHTLKMLAALLLTTLVSAISMAQVIYQDGNVRIIQADGWKILHGDKVVAYGDSPLDLDNMPPAFQAFIDTYADMPVQENTSRAQARNAAGSKADSIGPMLTTQWNQGDPYNQVFPTVNGVPTLVGCTTIATAQVLNYYRHCTKLDLKGRNQAYSDLESPYFYDMEKTFEGNYYNYTYAYTPDFDKINSDMKELSSFLFGIALAQHAYFDVDGTMTSIFTQRGALDNVFGYDYDLYENAATIESQMIASLKEKKPLIMSGNNPAAGHSFNIDGYNGTDKFHVNYGWGGLSDGWYELPNCGFFTNLKAVSAYPSDGTRVKMQAIPASIHIKGTDNKYDKTFKMTPAWKDAEPYTPENLVELEPGNYTFYFEYADGQTIAPYLEDFAPLSKMHESVISYGKYISSPAEFNVGYKCKVNFWHAPNMGYIEVLAQDFEDPEFKNYHVSLIMDGQTKPMSLGDKDDIYQDVNHNITVDLTPGAHEFMFYIAEYDTTIGKAERCGEGPWTLYYGMQENGMGWSSTYNESPFNIIVANYAKPKAGDSISVKSVKIKITLDKYCDGRVKITDYTEGVYDNVPLLKADDNTPAYNILGLPADDRSRIIIRNGKKILRR